MTYKPSVHTFDVFDTLIARRCIFPKKIFELVEKKSKIDNFAQIREAAERDFLGKCEYTIEDIYKNIKSRLNLSNEATNKLKTQELLEEIENCIPIKENIEKVNDGDILISDMYLSEKFIRSMLEKAGLKKKFSLIVSNYGKHSRNIWPKLMASFQIVEHLGDNPEADGMSPGSYGIKFLLTNASQTTQIEDILLKTGFSKLAISIREVRLKTSASSSVLEHLKNNQILMNFPILFLSSIYLKNLAIKHKKKNIIFSARDCYLWKNLFEAMFPGEFSCSYYYTSRYAKINTTKDYIKYSESIIDETCILVDLSGSGWSTEKLLKKLNLSHITTFFIHKLPKDREYMKNYIEKKCNFHSIIDENTQGFQNHKLEIANFAPHPMVRSVKFINDTLCPIFFENEYTSSEKEYVSYQNMCFEKCISNMKKIGMDENMIELLNKSDETIINYIKLFYKILSEHNDINTIYSKNFFHRNLSIENQFFIKNSV